MPVPLVIIVGQTATGKSAAAMDLAQRVNGEIICADARTIYKGMDIGTAKPSPADRKLVPHHVIDIIEPNERFSAAQFKALALAAIDDITERGKIPIIVGGTGLYVDAVLFDFAFRPVAAPEQRERLNSLSVPALQQLLLEEGIPLPQNTQNPRHLIRTIETGGVMAHRSDLRSNTLVLGLTLERDKLVERINQRVTTMIDQGLEAEVHNLAARFGWEAPGLLTIGYREWKEYFAGSRTLEETTELIQISTRQYAKRQQAWFKRNDAIRWIDDLSKIVDIATTFLNKTIS